jgi:Domain of unknown function (DUF4263)
MLNRREGGWNELRPASLSEAEMGTENGDILRGFRADDCTAMLSVSSNEIATLTGRPFWPALRSPRAGLSILRTIVSDWRAMISCDERRIEADYHSFIAKHAGFFFVEHGIDYPIVLSKIKLGSAFETDFVVCRDGRSLGLKYEFVELETPDSRPFTKDGCPTARLSRAIQQIEDWRGWLAANRNEAKRLFPSWAFLHNDQPTFDFAIVIGTRENSAQWAHKRNALGERLNISIRSYDALTDVLENRRFPALETSRVDAAILPPVKVLHELANPFFCCLHTCRLGNDSSRARIS